MSLLDRLPPRMVMIASLPDTGEAPAPDPAYRNATPNDLPALALLLVVAYAGTVDDLGQTLAEALEEIEQHTVGQVVGPPLWDCSFVALHSGTPVSVVLTTEENKRPLFAYVYTHPAHQRRGHATATLRRGMHELHTRGYDHVRLKVALANEGARRLYESIGFRPQ